jgi:hypothetical protein
MNQDFCHKVSSRHSPPWGGGEFTWYGGSAGLLRLTHSAGLEPATLGSEDRCSIQLSYECSAPIGLQMRLLRLIEQMPDDASGRPT